MSWKLFHDTGFWKYYQKGSYLIEISRPRRDGKVTVNLLKPTQRNTPRAFSEEPFRYMDFTDSNRGTNDSCSASLNDIISWATAIIKELENARQHGSCPVL